MADGRGRGNVERNMVEWSSQHPDPEITRIEKNIQ